MCCFTPLILCYLRTSRFRKANVLLMLACFSFVLLTFGNPPARCLLEKNIGSLTPKELEDYFAWKNRTSCELVHNLGGTVHRDGVRGQRAVCMDPLLRPVRVRRCIAYSFGKDANLTFAQALVDLNCDTYVFGSELPDVNTKRSEMLHKYPQIELGVENEGKFKTLVDIYRMFNHHDGKVVDYVNINVLSEVEILEQILESNILLITRQLSIALHLPNNGDIQELRIRAKLLKALEERQFVRFDSKHEDRGYVIAWYV